MSEHGSEFGFKRANIAKAFLTLDIKSPDPKRATSVEKSMSNNNVIPQPLPANTVHDGGIKASLQTIPIEIRLRIYKLLVTSWFDRNENPSWAVGFTNQKVIVLSMGRFPMYRTMETAILRTCKTIYYEANPMLYSNVFGISEPQQMFKLIGQIGLENLKLIKNLEAWVSYNTDVEEWVHLLQVLAKYATGLRTVKFGFGAKIDSVLEERGLGDDIAFVRALGGIQGLNELVLDGYYAEHWPAYLRDSMKTQVTAFCGHYQEERKLDEEAFSREELKFERELNKLRIKNNEAQLKQFMKYQKGTSALIP